MIHAECIETDLWRRVGVIRHLYASNLCLASSLLPDALSWTHLCTLYIQYTYLAALMTRLYIHPHSPLMTSLLCAWLCIVHIHTQPLWLPSYAVKCPLPCLYTYHTQSPFVWNDHNDDGADDIVVRRWWLCWRYQCLTMMIKIISTTTKILDQDWDVQGWALDDDGKNL